MEAKKGAPVYSLHPPMMATFPDDPLESSPVHRSVCSEQQSWGLELSILGQHANASLVLSQP